MLCYRLKFPYKVLNQSKTTDIFAANLIETYTNLVIFPALAACRVFACQLLVYFAIAAKVIVWLWDCHGVSLMTFLRRQ